MYENKTPEEIRQSILENTGSEVSKIEGSFASDMAAPVSLEMSNIYGGLDSILATFFISEATGNWLDRRGNEYGVIRKEGSKATADVTFSGTDGTIIPKGTQLVATNGLIFLTDEAVTIASNVASVGVTASAVGTAYNVAAATITQTYKLVIGVSSVTNENAATGGVDLETDDALRERILLRLQAPATSGNVYHYQQWALETAGVGAAKVLPLNRGNGTVDVMIVDQNREPVDSSIVTACYNHIEEVRPIGANVSVYSATGVTISVSATVTVSESTTTSSVQTAFQSAISDYFREVAFTVYTISINKIAYLLMSIDGVMDYTTLTLNGSSTNVSLESDEVPVLGTVTISESV